MSDSQLLQLGITEVFQRIQARELSPVELVRAYLERIERLNPSLNVYLTVMAESALAAATAALLFEATSVYRMASPSTVIKRV